MSVSTDGRPDGKVPQASPRSNDYDRRRRFNSTSKARSHVAFSSSVVPPLFTDQMFIILKIVKQILEGAIYEHETYKKQ